MLDENNMKSVIDAARAGATATQLVIAGHLEHWLIPGPDGSIVKAIDTEAGQNTPIRKRGHIKVFDAASFNAVLHANADAGNIVVYIDRDATAPAIVAIMNDHGEHGPGWQDFRAEIVFRFTPQWTKWKGIDGKMLTQAGFAEFIEDNLSDIASPSGAEMLEIAQHLTATRSVDFKSAMRLSSGSIQFQNIESTDARVGAGQIAVPEVFTLGIAPVFGLPPFRIEARFRYRIQDGKLALGIKLQRVEDVMAAVINDMVSGMPASDGRPAVVGIVAPEGSVIVDGIAPLTLNK